MIDKKKRNRIQKQETIMCTIDDHIKKLVSETVENVSVALFSKFGDKLLELEKNDKKFVDVFSLLNNQLEQQQHTILSLRKQLEKVHGQLDTSRMINSNLSLELKNNNATNISLDKFNKELTDQNMRLKKRGRTYMKFEDKLHMIIQNVVHWECNNFYVSLKDMRNIFEHASKPDFEFKRTLKSRGYKVEKLKWKETDHFVCSHPYLSKRDIHAQIHLYKKKRLDDDNLWENNEEDTWDGNSLSSDSLFNALATSNDNSQDSSNSFDRLNSFEEIKKKI